jgi:hypothetical protein
VDELGEAHFHLQKDTRLIDLSVCGEISIPRILIESMRSPQIANRLEKKNKNSRTILPCLLVAGSV